MGEVSVERSIVVSARREDLWMRLADTDRINRLLGLDAVRYSRIEDRPDSPARFRGTTRMAGLTSSYDEAPFEWTAPERFSVVRVFSSGPLSDLRLVCALEDVGGETRVTYSIGATPRSVLMRPIASAGLRRAAGDFIELAKALAKAVAEGADDPFAGPVTASDQGALHRAASALAASGVDASIVQKLVRYVERSADADAQRMQPFALADAWGIPRRVALAAFLRGVEAGLLELRWAVLCPSCRGASDEVASLQALGEGGHCHMCDIGFSLELDRSVEATFTVHPAIRPHVEQLFCRAGPAKTPHVLAQRNAARGEVVELRVPAAERRLQLFARGGARATVLVEPDAPERVLARIGDNAVDPPNLRVAPQGVIAIDNDSASPRHVKLERLEWASAAATAHDVSTMPEFSAVFGSAILKPKTPLRVSRVALMFSDLTGSTALYSDVGDAQAFRLVDDHYDVLREAIVEHGGRVIKTMGDAIMASFVDDASCVRGAVASLAAFQRFRSGAQHGALVDLKLGVFAGPCYAVEANGTLDYFGQVVNVASRLQHLASSGELVLPTALASALPDGMRASAAETVRVKGVDDPIEIVRVRLA